MAPSPLSSSKKRLSSSNTNSPLSPTSSNPTTSSTNSNSNSITTNNQTTTSNNNIKYAINPNLNAPRKVLKKMNWLERTWVWYEGSFAISMLETVSNSFAFLLFLFCFPF